MTAYTIIEKENPLHVHAHCSSKESAQRWLDNNAVEYCAKGYFMDKTLVPTDFMMIEREFKKRGA
jgi:hypothetical protein